MDKVYNKITIWIIKNIIWILIVPIILVLGSYMCNFIRNDISSDPSYWAYFGDYVGGILGVFFGIINILILVSLTVYIRQREENEMFFNLKLKVYTEICNVLDEIEIKKKIREGSIRKVLQLVKHYDFLFLKSSVADFYSRVRVVVEEQLKKNVTEVAVSEDPQGESILNGTENLIITMRDDLIKLSLEAFQKIYQVSMIQPYYAEKVVEIENEFNDRINELRSKYGIQELESS